MQKRNLQLMAMYVLLVSWGFADQYSWGAPDEQSSDVQQTFTVENMTCATCPITVRAAMSRVKGVKRVEVDFKAKSVTVFYDPTMADAATIAKASTSVGFTAHAVDKP